MFLFQIFLKKQPGKRHLTRIKNFRFGIRIFFKKHPGNRHSTRNTDFRFGILIFLKKHPEKRHLAEIADFRFEIWIFLKTTLEIWKSDISEKATRKTPPGQNHRFQVIPLFCASLCAIWPNLQISGYDFGYLWKSTLVIPIWLEL